MKFQFIYNILIHVLTFTLAYISLSDKLVSPYIYERFLNAEYLCACLKKNHANWPLSKANHQG